MLKQLHILIFLHTCKVLRTTRFNVLPEYQFHIFNNYNNFLQKKETRIEKSNVD